MGERSGVRKTLPGSVPERRRAEGLRSRSDDSDHHSGSCRYVGVEAGESGDDDGALNDSVQLHRSGIYLPRDHRISAVSGLVQTFSFFLEIREARIEGS